MNDLVQVGISEMRISADGEKFITYALGSCVGVCLYDSTRNIGAMMHIMLPYCMKAPPDNLFKYANTAILKTLKTMQSLGCRICNIKAKIAGGAKMIETSTHSIFENIGEKNVSAVKDILNKQGIELVSQDIGLNYGRTMVFDTKTGQVIVKSYSCSDVIL